MKIVIVHAHWDNRGDEAALRAMVDELHLYFPKAEILIQVNSLHPQQFPYRDGNNIELSDFRYPKRKNYLTFPLVYLSKGKLTFFENEKQLVKTVRNADIVLHGPGGPSIGDIYYKDELSYLLKLFLIKRMGIRYGFYAPSMGPFTTKNKIRNWLRKQVLNGADLLYLREPMSKEYLKDFGLKRDISVSLDSAFQHAISIEDNQKKLESYEELSAFLKKYTKIVGVTVTDLQWHPRHKNNPQILSMIQSAFESFIKELDEKGYGVVFIPQLFGKQQDKDYMSSFSRDNCFTISDEYDCYFQQYVISQLYAVVGMRYHSNIFSAKMGTPFVSIAYEQKMTGFMQTSQLEQYCIPIEQLSYQLLSDKFGLLENNYSSYKEYLMRKNAEWKKESYRTTQAVIDLLEKADK